MKKRLLLICATFALTLSCMGTKTSFALTPPEDNLTEERDRLKRTLQNSDLVFVGTVKDIVEKKFVKDGGDWRDDLYYEYITFQVREVLQGNWTDKTYTARCEGWLYDGKPYFKVGQDSLVFTRTTARSACDISRRYKIKGENIFTEDGYPVSISEDEHLSYEGEPRQDLRSPVGRSIWEVRRANKHDGKQMTVEGFSRFLKQMSKSLKTEGKLKEERIEQADPGKAVGRGYQHAD